MEPAEQPHPEFRPYPNTQSEVFNFDKEVEWLLVKLYSGEAPFKDKNATRFIGLAYDEQEVHFLHDENLSTAIE